MDLNPETVKLIAAAVAIGMGGFAPAIAIGVLVHGAVSAIGRNPEAQAPIQTSLVLGIAFAEGIAIFALVVALILLLVV